MLIDRYSSTKSLASSVIQSKDSLTESNNLLKVLGDIIADCPFCLSKLKEKKKAGVDKTPSQQDDKTTQPQVSSEELYHEQYQTRQQ